MHALRLSTVRLGATGGQTESHSQETEMRNAVEASVSRAKALGAKSNLYIVEGDDHAYASGYSLRGDAGFRISTRSQTRPTRVGYLFRTEYTIETLWPRPCVAAGWGQAANGLWYKNGD